ncbi:hypothetical protein Rleg10DRAFT_3607 [Rhizobium leguminosarum bv. trifolii WSM2012]|nr:hypothetical protein Rleg10DRAFT_3607 [Rhizobium leguminosarum bv. trifolii WSM2012]
MSLNGQTLGHFIERNFLAIVDHYDNELLVRIQARGPSPTLLPCRRLASLALAIQRIAVVI